MEQRDFVVLVDEFGRDRLDHEGKPLTMGKMEVHRRGFLHRAVSVFIFSDKNELLLQRRADKKYHSPNKWSNTCCTHPLPEETPFLAAQRRLTEEMGLTTTLIEVFVFSYKADVGGGLIENEFDHVFFGVSNQDPNPDPIEVSDWDWIIMESLEKQLINNPKDFTPWLHPCFSKFVSYMYRKPELYIYKKKLIHEIRSVR